MAELHELASANLIEANRQFSLRNFERAIAGYTEELKMVHGNKLLKSMLLCNRSLALYNLARFVESLDDAIVSRLLNPKNIKAIYRGAVGFLYLRKYISCMMWCQYGLKLDKKSTPFQNIHAMAVVKLKRGQHAVDVLERVIRGKGINIEGGFDVDSLVTIYKHTAGNILVTVKEEIIWPVIFLYPEYRQSDFIGKFHENSSLYDHFVNIFSKPAPWDVKGEYTPDNLKAYFCNDYYIRRFGNEGESVTPVDLKSSLLTVMKHKRFKVRSGKLEFLITSLQFDKIYRTLNRVVE